MVTWILILFAHVGPAADGNSNALTSVSGFQSEMACELAGKKAATLASHTVKEVRYVCVKDR